MYAKFVNKSGAEINFTGNSPLILQDIDISTNVNLYTSKGVGQDGVSYNDNTLDIADLSMSIVIDADSIEERDLLKSRINKAFNPKTGEGYLFYKERKIKCIVNQLPYFSDIHYKASKGLISLTASSPFFEGLVEIRQDVSTEVGGFEFPLEFPVEGLELSIRTINFLTNIYNNGDVETPIRVNLRATGTVVNPVITNMDTGEFIRVNRTLSSGDILEVNTEFGNKRVDIIRENGDRENAFNYIDYKSTFFSISIGDTRLEYAAEVGENNLDVYIYYTPLFLGV